MTRLRPARLIAVALAAVVLASCRVDATVRLDVEPNGSGTVRVTVTADPEVVARAEGLADDLRAADLEAVGWRVDGPDATDDGGLRVVLVRSFDGPAQATQILSEINGPSGPLQQVALARAGKDTNSTWTLSGRLQVTGGLEAFADEATRALLGGAPYADEVQAAGLDIGAALGLTFEASIPGSIDATSGLPAGGTITWKIPLDGSSTDLATTVTNVDVASSVSRVARVLLLGLAVLWIGGAGALWFMVRARGGRPGRGPSPRTPRF